MLSGCFSWLMIVVSGATFLVLFVWSALMVWAVWDLGGPLQGSLAALPFAVLWGMPVVSFFTLSRNEPEENTAPE